VALNKFSDRKVKTLTKSGRYGDGGGLWLQVRDAAHKSWIFRFARAGRAREMGLGPLHDVSLAAAREAAQRCRAQLRDGLDPLEVRRQLVADNLASASGRSFNAAASEYISAHAPGWRNAKHAAQWQSTLTTYAAPIIGKLACGDVTTAHLAKILAPIWKGKTETAARVRGRIEAVLDFAAVRGWRSGDNPARWKGHLAELFPPRSRVAPVRHHPALPWREVSAFVLELRGREAMAARALEFAVLTAARTGEAIGATWAEIDTVARIWTVSADRMKMKRDHRVPLSPPAIKLLEQLRPENAKPEHFVFHNDSRARPISNMAMIQLLARMGRAEITVHGFRSSFRDWVLEATEHPRDLAELSLAHVNRDKVESAYARGDAIERRAKMMNDWAAFCGKPAATIASLDTRRAAKASP